MWEGRENCNVIAYGQIHSCDTVCLHFMCALCAFAGCHPNDSVGDSGDDSEYYPPATTQMLD